MIYLVRHGEAEAGWGTAPDPGLSELGHKQAEMAAEHLAAHTVTSLFCSPMKRCQETALPFSKRSGLEIETNSLVSEIPTPDGLDDRVAWLRGFMGGDWNAAPALLHDWRTGLLDAVQALPDDTVVFTHFIAINTIAGYLKGEQNVTSFRPGHCSVTILRKMDGGLEVSELGSEASTKVL